VAGQTDDLGSVSSVRIINNNIADVHTTHHAHSGTLRPACSVAKSQKNRRVDDVAHRDVGDRHILQRSTIDNFQRQPPRTIEHTI